MTTPPQPSPYQPPPGQPYPAQYTPPPKKRSKLPWILGGLGLVLLLCCGGGIAVMAVGLGGDDSPGQTVAQGDPARDGKFEFVVTGSSCGKSQVGTTLLTEKAQGVFCEINLSVKNIGKEAQLFDGSSQKAFDGNGTKYSNDGAAEIVANEGTPTFLEEINPGNQVTGTLLFDVPAGTKLTKIELHDSPFSGGVTVTLN